MTNGFPSPADPSDSGWVFADCPACDFTSRIAWPGDDRPQIELRCSGCHRWLDIERDGTVVAVREERGGK